MVELLRSCFSCSAAQAISHLEVALNAVRNALGTVCASGEFSLLLWASSTGSASGAGKNCHVLFSRYRLNLTNWGQ